MILRAITSIITLTFIFLALPIKATAHSGRTDSNGGHYNRSTGQYHYHNPKSGITQQQRKIKPRSDSRAGNYKTRLEDALASKSKSDREGNYLTRWQVKNGRLPSQLSQKEEDSGLAPLGTIDYEKLAARQHYLSEDKRRNLRLSQAVREAREALNMKNAIMKDRLKDSSRFQNDKLSRPTNEPKGKIVNVNLDLGSFRSQNGTLYKNAKCLKIQGDLVTIMHSFGVSRVKAGVLPANVRFKIGL